MMKMRKRTLWLQNVPLFLLLCIGAVAMIGPFVWMVSSSFKEPQEVISYPPTLIPSKATMANYHELTNRLPIVRLFRNSLFLAVSITLIQLFTSTLAGYVFAKFDFPGKEPIFIMVLSTMMLPFQVLMIPSYLLMIWLKWVNSFKALIIPSVFNAFGIFLLRQYMHNVPSDLIDAARIDGCSEMMIFFRIIIPLSQPALAALGIFTFISQWDNFLWPLIVINNERLFTLPLGLATFTNRFWTDYASVMAGSVVSVAPVLVAFFLLQRRFIEGITLTGLKG